MPTPTPSGPAPVPAPSGRPAERPSGPARVLGIGDNVVDRYPDLGLMFPGGNAVNVAVHARRAGADAAYWGVTGDDTAGAVVRRALAAEGVDTGRVRTEGGPNAWAEIGLVGGDRVFKGSDDGVSVFALDEEELDALAGWDVVHTAYSGSLADQVPDMAARTRVSFDFSHHWNQPWAAPLYPHLHLAAFSASQLGTDEVAGLLRQAVRQGVRWALATRGGDGAVLTDGDSWWRQPPVATPAVDTLGAGDAFIGTLLAALAAGGDPRQGLARAAEAAARTCTAHGAFGHPAPLPAPGPEEPAPALGEDDPRGGPATRVEPSRAAAGEKGRTPSGRTARTGRNA
ncbi:PfkB family carbohydrate kinase [Streptomyces albus]|uniref:PfkB family carbohydrate kinase n=1 Tax=Streptomyces TaxID=1883 RepID=UPI0004C104A7|nr:MULTISPECIES: PfkB family carbohydrate kinase [unclassified Streptomyces]